MLGTNIIQDVLRMVSSGGWLILSREDEIMMAEAPGIKYGTNCLVR